MGTSKCCNDFSVSPRAFSAAAHTTLARYVEARVQNELVLKGRKLKHLYTTSNCMHICSDCSMCLSFDWSHERLHFASLLPFRREDLDFVGSGCLGAMYGGFLEVSALYLQCLLLVLSASLNAA